MNIMVDPFLKIDLYWEKYRTDIWYIYIYIYIKFRIGRELTYVATASTGLSDSRWEVHLSAFYNW